MIHGLSHLFMCIPFLSASCCRANTSTPFLPSMQAEIAWQYAYCAWPTWPTLPTPTTANVTFGPIKDNQSFKAWTTCLGRQSSKQPHLPARYPTSELDTDQEFKPSANQKHSKTYWTHSKNLCIFHKWLLVMPCHHVLLFSQSIKSTLPEE